ncbi:hypothetical protein HYX18_02120 [Candidatus Woesearchaeota archaeon]|nr:hypothetical protein [Candidatus Woesearchaeota archaeon]
MTKATIDSYVLGVRKSRVLSAGSPIKYYYNLKFPTEDSEILNAFTTSLDLLASIVCLIADKDKSKSTSIVVMPTGNSIDYNALSGRELKELEACLTRTNTSPLYNGRLKIEFKYDAVYKQ